MLKPPFYPIVYLRGYAGTQAAVEDTTATPYMGFNLGSTKLRQLHTGDLQTHVFESPLVRLIKDYGYHDAYHDGDILPQGPIDPRSVWIYRYYDVVSEELGEGDRKKIEYHARGLRTFLRHVRKSVLGRGEDPGNFRVYLVAHSMGGLVCRCYLQNAEILGLDDQPTPTWEQKGVDKLFTFGTPHGGIEFRQGLGWAAGVRDFFDANNSATFGPKRMREYLSLGPD
jgi:pimeloyl-ACP methyl ester carboxylesterase